MKTSRKSNCQIFLICAIWLMVMILALCNLSKIKFIYPTVSLRYNNSISAKSADDAYSYAVQASETNTIWPTFWAESKENIVSEFCQQKANCIWARGDFQIVYPAKFLMGGYPSELDYSNICISSSLAWDLFGSIDALDFYVNIDALPYKVCGVFQSEKNLALISCGKSKAVKNWTAVELGYLTSSEGRNAASDFATATSLGEADVIIDAFAINDFWTLLTVLPAFILLVYAMAIFIIWCYKHLGKKREIIFFFFAIVISLSLPFIFSFIPNYIIPNQWSDFTYISKMICLQMDNLRNFLSCLPMLKDVDAKLLMIQQSIIIIALLILTIHTIYIIRFSSIKDNEGRQKLKQVKAIASFND